MKTITLTTARRKLASVVTAARRGEPVALSSHGKPVAFVVGNSLERDELLSDLKAVQEGREEAKKRGTIPAEKVFGKKEWRKAVKRAVSR